MAKSDRDGVEDAPEASSRSFAIPTNRCHVVIGVWIDGIDFLGGGKEDKDKSGMIMIQNKQTRVGIVPTEPRSLLSYHRA